jgi:hypothetical protein
LLQKTFSIVLWVTEQKNRFRFVSRFNRFPFGHISIGVCAQCQAIGASDIRAWVEFDMSMPALTLNRRLPMSISNRSVSQFQYARPSV